MTAAAPPEISPTPSAWKPTACILCECNCGLEVQLGGEGGRRLVKLRGDKAHPASQGYACEKAHKLDHYQNGKDRVLAPMRRRDDGTFEAVGWETAVAEVAERLAAVRDTHGGASIFYYGGGGQGNHLPGAYASATRRVLGARYRSNALAQEKTGEFWVAERMVGAATRGDFERCDVAMFLGKNPWFSHGIPRARTTLKALAKDPARTLIVVDPRRTKTAEMADLHLQVKPGTDAWLVAALVKVLLDDGHVDEAFVEARTDGIAAVRAAFEGVDVAAYAAHCDVPEAQIRQAATLIGEAERFASFEDLGVQMNRHSTLVSYLHRLTWLTTGNVGRRGTHLRPTVLVPMADGHVKHHSPVTDAPLIGGLVPCNVIAEEILTDHPDRFRAMIVEAANPAHSLADSPAFREAMAALDFSVVIDVAMTETAKCADYVLPAASQYEKAEATFFNFEFPHNAFQLRQALFGAPAGPDGGEGPLPEAEIHTRLVEALGGLDGLPLDALSEAAEKGLGAYAMAFVQHVAMQPKRVGVAPAILYRTLGPVLPEAAREGAVLLGVAFKAVMTSPKPIAKAGFAGPPPIAATKLFEAMLSKASGVVFAESEWEDADQGFGVEGGRIQLGLDDLLEEVRSLEAGPEPADPAFPFVLAAGERRAFTANTILRDDTWRKKDPEGALRMHPEDAAKLGVAPGGRARVTTKRGSAVVHVAVSETMRPGHVSLPNGMGLDGATPELGGVSLNELTDKSARDKFAGTPWHKHVPARVEAVA